MIWRKNSTITQTVEVMSNPFETRATEYLRDNAAFLSIVTPEPLYTFFEKPAVAGSLFNRLCIVIGTPGSGKTTIATLMQFGTVHTLINSPNHTEYRPLQNALSKCKMIDKNHAKVLGCRIPMESEYRDFWELPYCDEIKFGLLKSFLQARAVISWFNSLKDTSQYDLKKTIITYRNGASVAKESIGGDIAENILTKAKDVERSIYNISAALVPPIEENLPPLTKTPYHPFDAISEIVVKDPNSDKSISLQPLVILDDVHSLHPKQLSLMRDWLAKREMRISRWMLMRLDAQTPEAVLLEGVASNSDLDTDTTLQKSREITPIWLQSSDDRAKNRKKFRIMARNMADKYLRLMPVFNRQGLVHFQDLLNSRPTHISDSNLNKLKKKVDHFQTNSHISPENRASLEQKIEIYFSSKENNFEEKDVKLAMLYILLNRYVKRVPQASLFDIESLGEPKKPIKADSGVADGARIFLLHEFKRPYYFGIDAVCDGSAENAEQFLQLAGRLVNASETRIIRGTTSELPSKYQHKLLKEKADNIVREWAFPKHVAVKKICSYIAEECVAKSLEPNASLGGGANAFGIPNEEFENISENYPDLAHILKFGVAYSAFSIKRYHRTKNRLWTLIELSGPFLITKGLTYARGGFLERRLRDLLKALEGK